MAKPAKVRMSEEEVRYWQELRRSSASSKHLNKKKYNRTKDKRFRHER